MATAAEVDGAAGEADEKADEELDPCAIPCSTRIVRNGIIVHNILGDYSCLDLCIPKRTLGAVLRLGSECGPCEEGSRFAPTATPSESPTPAPSLSHPPTAAPISNPPSAAPTPEPTSDPCLPCATFVVPEDGIIVRTIRGDGICLDLCIARWTLRIAQENANFECGVCEGGQFASSTPGVAPSLVDRVVKTQPVPSGKDSH